MSSFWTPAIALALVGFGLNGTLLHRVGFWEDIGMSLRLVAWGTMLDPLMVAVSALGFGILADRIGIRRISVFMGVTFSAALLPLLLTTGQAYTIFLHGFLWGTAAGAFMSVNNLIWPSYFGRRYLGAIRGTATLMYVAGAGIGGPVYGLLLDAGIEPDIVWGMSIGVVSLASLLLFTSRPPRVGANEAA
jgi:MFS family permease